MPSVSLTDDTSRIFKVSSALSSALIKQCSFQTSEGKKDLQLHFLLSPVQQTPSKGAVEISCKARGCEKDPRFLPHDQDTNENEEQDDTP